MPLALDQMHETSSDGKQVPALDRSHMEEMMFVMYTSPPTLNDERADQDAWMERINYLHDDLHWLLKLPHDKFWCQVVFDENLHKALDSFLRYCPRSADTIANLPEAMKQRQMTVYRQVFMTYLRISTYKESKEHFITPSVFGEILYENFLLDIPKILDLCSLYGKTNGTLLGKMLNNIVTQQPKYINDLRETIPTLIQESKKQVDKAESDTAMKEQLSLFTSANALRKSAKQKESEVLNIDEELKEKEALINTLRSKQFSRHFLQLLSWLILPMFEENCLLQNWQVLGNIAARCGIQLEHWNQSPQKLDASRPGASLETMATDDLQDVVLYLSDMARTLHRFLDIYNPACQVFHESNFCTVLANFYDCVTPRLTAALKQHDYAQGSVKKELLLQMRHAKRFLLTIFHHIVSCTTLQPVLENGSNNEMVTSCIEDFLHVMTSVLGERRFLAAYEGVFSFQDDMDLLTQASSAVDVSQFEYIQSAINSAFSTFGHRKSPRGDTNTGGRTSPDGAPDSAGNSSTTNKGAAFALTVGRTGSELSNTGPKTLGREENHKDDSEAYAASCPRPGDVEVDSLVSSVKDLLPALGEGYIEAMLEELGWDAEKVISCVLEDNIPPSLKDIPVDMTRQQREVNQGDGRIEDSDDVLTSRLNVFDNDEFDLFNRKDVDISKIHIGKKQHKVDLEDKSVIKSAKATYDAYGSRDQESIYDNSQTYEDEYDDTYDSHEVGADDADSAEELNSKKIVPRVLQDLQRQKARESGRGRKESASDDSGSDKEAENQATTRNFVMDPAKLREQAAQRKQSQALRGRGGRGSGTPARTRDVVGSTKGQGQSQEVQHNRQVKGKFKGQRHRAMADKKMSKGMF